MTENCQWGTRIDLPFPPSVNHYWRNIVIKGHPRTIISSAGRKYRTTVHRIMQTEYADIPCLAESVEIEVKLYPPDRRRRDLDNYMKSLLDSLAGFAFEDDSQIKAAHIRMEPKCEGGRCSIRIRAL